MEKKSNRKIFKHSNTKNTTTKNNITNNNHDDNNNKTDVNVTRWCDSCSYWWSRKMISGKMIRSEFRSILQLFRLHSTRNAFMWETECAEMSLARAESRTRVFSHRGENLSLMSMMMMMMMVDSDRWRARDLRLQVRVQTHAVAMETGGGCATRAGAPLISVISVS